jgi:hypothetical protein
MQESFSVPLSGEGSKWTKKNPQIDPRSQYLIAFFACEFYTALRDLLDVIPKTRM